MVRTPRSPDAVSARVITVRLTPAEKSRLDALVVTANAMLRKSGLPEAVCASSLIRSLIDRAHAEAEQSISGIASTAMAWSTPIELQAGRVSVKGTTGQVIAPTRFERILGAQIVPNDHDDND